MIKGNWYPIDSSKRYDATLSLSGKNYRVNVLDLEQGEGEQTVDNRSLHTGKWSEVRVSNRLGQTERKLTLADGSVFATLDNDAVDAIIKDQAGFKTDLWVHKHESKLSSVLVMLALTIGFVSAFFKWGLPWTSHAVAHALPQKTGEVIGKQSLEFIDKYFLESTEISQSEQDKIKKRFETRLKPLDEHKDINYTIHFRKMEMGGVSVPNAFALPSGDLVLTDKFVQMSENDDEIDSVLLHEMGHVVHRHSLEMLTQSSLTTMIVMLALGNPDGTGELVTGLGTALVSNHYSREKETEADAFAFKKMLKGGINPQAFVNILSRMEAYANDEMTDDRQESDKSNEANHQDAQNHEDQHNENADDDQDGSVTDFFSTHPSTQARIDMAKKYGACYQQGLTVCE
ncbi:M48 family metallopeptidase [Psychrobacter sp. HD31]|uniref:M48 family metallopeptidase n=1 Tax=Psychrobacter sp. HD31 TaxID=3112003 RepID=UPI003DA63F65